MAEHGSSDPNHVLTADERDVLADALFDADQEDAQYY